MAKESNPDIGSLLLWVGIAYVAYELYTQSAVGGSANTGAASATAPAGTTGSTAAILPGSSAGTPLPSLSAGGSNPGMVSLSDLSTIFQGGESGTVATPAAQPLPSYVPSANDAYAAQIFANTANLSTPNYTPAQVAQQTAQVFANEAAEGNQNPVDSALADYFTSHAYSRYVSPGVYDYSATMQPGMQLS